MPNDDSPGAAECRTPFAAPDEPRDMPTAAALPPPAAARRADHRPGEGPPLYLRTYRHQILFWTTIGYGTFYFVRKNLSVAMPVMEQQLGLSKASLGLILTLHGLVYGVSKFANGFAADRANARVFMATALFASALINICFGLSASLVFVRTLLDAQRIFSRHGLSALCAAAHPLVLARRNSPRKCRSGTPRTRSAAARSSSSAATSSKHFDSWQVCFFVPAAIAMAMSGLLFVFLRDTPESVGLPEIEGTHVPGGDTAADSPAQFKQFLWDRVFSNKYIWLVSAANFFVYTIRFAVFDWGPTMLKEFKGVELCRRRLDGRGLRSRRPRRHAHHRLPHRSPVRRTRRAAQPDQHVVVRAVDLPVLDTPGHMVWLNTALLMSAGFFVYGPQALVAVVVANLATKRAAATAVGLTSIFGYASTVLSGWGMGYLVEHYGWAPAFACLIGTALIGALLFAAALPAKAHGYADASGGTPAETL